MLRKINYSCYLPRILKAAIADCAVSADLVGCVGSADTLVLGFDNPSRYVNKSFVHFARLSMLANTEIAFASGSIRSKLSAICRFCKASNSCRAKQKLSNSVDKTNAAG